MKVKHTAIIMGVSALIAALTLAFVMVVLPLLKAAGEYVPPEREIIVEKEAFTAVEKYDETLQFYASFENGEIAPYQSTIDAEQTKKNMGSTSNGNSPMTTALSNGPQFRWENKQQAGFTGTNALIVSATHSGKDEAYCRNLLYSDLNIPVKADTCLSYVIYPQTPSANGYDYEYTATYIALDLRFTDGTYLSSLGAVNQNGYKLDPVAQGNSDALLYNQWNYIASNIGAVAHDKTIEQILVYYRKPSSASARADFTAFIDDITVSDITGTEYKHLADYVNPLAGTNSSSELSRGLTTATVSYPHGFNMFTPVTNPRKSLPYYYQLSAGSNTMKSIQITHFASHWVGYYDTWQFMPNTRIAATSVNSREQIDNDARAAEFSHANEKGTAYYYSVQFDKGSAASDVLVELTPTMYGASVRFTFPEGSPNCSIIFDCDDGNGFLKFADDGKSLTAYSDYTIQGSKRMHIYGTFDTAAQSSKVVEYKSGIVTFPAGTRTVTFNLATSFISAEQAQKNYGYDFAVDTAFDEVAAETRYVWDKELSVVEIEGANYSQMSEYYTCLYKTLVYPSLITENTGTAEKPVWQYSSPYSGSNDKPAVIDGAIVFNSGLWDSYRTAWPWYSSSSKDVSLMDGLLSHYDENGWNGAWIAARGFQCMIGTHSDIIYADGAIKGLRYDYSKAMLSMLRNAATVKNKGGVGREEQETAVFTGYVTNDTPRGMSWTLDNALNDFGIYVMAQKLGMTDEAAYYKNRAKTYVNVYNSAIGFFIGKDANGNWSKDKNNYNPVDWLSDYTEANGWNMAFNMVYDVGGMISLYGGDNAFIAKLDEYFGTPITNVSSTSIHEIREAREVRLGQYVHSNQVAHHILYMYDFVGQPWKTQQNVRRILARCYSGAEIGQGYLGDEDTGEQSAWYVYSALGFYPTALATGEYTIGSPLFEKVTLHLSTGDVVIKANNNSAENVYIASCKVNGEDYNKTYITQEMLDSGVTIEFEMTNAPTAWGTALDSRPYSLTAYGEKPDYMSDTTAAAKVTSTASNAANLTDNTSNTVAKSSDGNMEIVLEYNKAVKAQIVTLTSAKNSRPTITSYKIEASKDGKSYTTLDSRKNIEFEFALYTKPLLIPEKKQDEYKYYRITLTSDEKTLKIAQVELIG